MINPVLRIRLAIQGSLLNIHILVSGVKVDVANCRSLPCNRTLDANALKVGWNDEIDILARVWE